MIMNSGERGEGGMVKWSVDLHTNVLASSGTPGLFVIRHTISVT